jgi:2-oxoglutarate dehydrogenase complex dehydrogenase (E1) component-like enzyme
VYFDLTKELTDDERERVAIVRIEQFYPFAERGDRR